MLGLITTTDYLSDAAVLIKFDHGFFAYTQHDLSMAGGCTDCVGPCKIGLLKYAFFNGQAITSAPGFSALMGRAPKESLYDFSNLSAEAIALGEELDSSDVICRGHHQHLDSKTQGSLGRRQGAQSEYSTTNDARARAGRRARGRFGKISAGAITIFPEYTECRPDVTVEDSTVESKLAFATDGSDLLSDVPDGLKLYPYSFTSSMPARSRVVPASNTKYGASTILEPEMQAYYGGCRVREVNTTGVYIEDACKTSKHWESYGLMVQTSEDLPLCSTGGVCIRNYFNTQWEVISTISADNPNRTAIAHNSYRTRYADTVGISVLPGVVVIQILLMGVVSLYQVMSHKHSVLLTQVWAYRCQNGRMQPIYLAQISYHLIYNSDLYLLGFATGTLTMESIANLACCFFAFSYSFINMVKARSGDQKLDREFRLMWEAMQIAITAAVVIGLKWVQHTPLAAIISENAQILRKSSTLGAKYCGLNDACIVFTVNIVIVAIVASMSVGVTAVIASKVAKMMSRRTRNAAYSTQSGSKVFSIKVLGSSQIESADKESKPELDSNSDGLELTTFEQNCIGVPFNRLFTDCDDIVYVLYNDKRCVTVEAVLLAGYLYYGEHIYQASSVMLLVIARYVPRKMLRTINVLLLRWNMDPKTGTLARVQSCTWFTASDENHKSQAVPVP
ncbi:hypothetical protein PR003_g8876 [Phytophthora rubi]|uniref:Uncharacterized protein n=2 Tax=Phytophthora rubi TaxID=129364 RepID=A0A6A4FFV9_9STRA|nr:hypothetical protein PR003_g8876 [Phytophthora rubi]